MKINRFLNHYLFEQANDGTGSQGGGLGAGQSIKFDDGDMIPIPNQIPAEPIKKDELIKKDEPKPDEGSSEEDVVSDANTIILVGEDGTESTFKLDDNGNAVNEAGEIIQTAEQLAELNVSHEDDIWEEVGKLSGIVPLDENGQHIVFTNDANGIAAREAHVYEMANREGAQKAIKDLYETHPDIKAMMEYKSRFGSLDGFGQYTDYTKMEVTKNSKVEDLKMIVGDYYKSLGLPNADIENLIGAMEANETLLPKAVESLNALKANKLAKDEADQKQLELEYAEHTKKLEDYYGIVWGADSIKDAKRPGSMYDMIVNKGEVGDFSIPKAGITITKDGEKKLISREDILAYIAKPIQTENGVFSQYQIDSSKDNSKENIIVDAIRLLSGGKIGSAMKHLVAKQVANTYKSIKRVSGSNSKPNAWEGKSDDDINTKLASGAASIK